MGHTTKPKYSRALYKHWVDEDRDCQDARVEVLVRDAAGGSVRFADQRECAVELGRWPDPYTGNVVTIPGGLDVDHMVPLKHAHDTGAWRWSAERRQQYANDLRYRWHLLAVSASTNRAKGDKGPDKWKPENRDFWCHVRAGLGEREVRPRAQQHREGARGRSRDARDVPVSGAADGRREGAAASTPGRLH